MEVLEMHHGMMVRHAGALAVSLALFSAAPALADGNPDRPRLDTNGDGSVDLAEIQAARPDFTAEKFRAVDGNGDGLLSRDELRAAHGKARAMFSRIDQDGSGGVSLSEMQAHRSGATQEDFAKLDTDGNGQLSAEELKAGRQKHRKQYGKAPPAQPNEG
jgi:hypothetical protein